ncbi:hypothetical protein F511_31385 [Dorcoceras hygrometricum]|uniref:Pentatricopeptide repeat-containing protein n=1 Tax=Dorcoceras hygrometricum TaxID=472368 RepID=A0A2Z7BAH6_9LAMI|nr:hypothetical protein F511_31385 [Dorcoceras hygrometricum]
MREGLMASLVCNLLPFPSPICMYSQSPTSIRHFPSMVASLFQDPLRFKRKMSRLYQQLALSCINGVEGCGISEEEEKKMKSKWVRKGFNSTEEQRQDVSQLPSKMSNRCKALMRKIICFSREDGSVPVMLNAWVKSTKPRRTDWLSILKELERLNHPLYFEILEHALTEESFEANIRDYTKAIHFCGKDNRLSDAERLLLAMKTRGFICDQVTLTALVHMYSKAGDLKLAQDSFEEMRLLGVPLDKRSYGSMIMAYIRAGMFQDGETLLRETEVKEVFAGREVYKALLRSYSMAGDSHGAQRVFDAIQWAGITPDDKVCALLINAYVVSGKTCEARIAFDNMRRAGLEPNDKCVALVLAAYEKENRVSEALEFLTELERASLVLGKEASQLLAEWFRGLGVVEEVELVLRDFV